MVYAIPTGENTPQGRKLSERRRHCRSKLHAAHRLDSAYVEAFYSRLRQECLNTSWFLSIIDARFRINNCKADHNETRPHSSLGNLTTSEFAAQLKKTRKVA